LSQGVSALRKVHPDNPQLQQLSEADHVIVSEPLGGLPGAWLEVPESTALVIEAGAHEQSAFVHVGPSRLHRT
jgi:hypothetical protein